MLIYIIIRFTLSSGIAAVICLTHDVLIMLALTTIFQIQVNTTFIAAVITIVGYSINATIVIFDRIREHIQMEQKEYGMLASDLKDVVNLSITETFTRSLNTSLTTFVMVLILFVLGVSSIREFALPLMAGIVCGTYSSICLTGAMFYLMSKNQNFEVKKEEEEEWRP